MFSAVGPLCDTRMMDTRHYTFVQTHRMSTTKSDPYGKLRTLGVHLVSLGEAVMTKYHRLGSLNKHFFLTALEAGKGEGRFCVW